MNVVDMLERDEGRSNVAYADPVLGWERPTIGVGHTGPEVVQGLVWSDAQVDSVLQSDIATATQGCEANLPWFDALNDARQAVLVCMAFQLGVHGMMGFPTFLGLVGQGRYSTAADDMRGTLWAHQTPIRVNRMASQMATGAWIP